MNPRLFSVYLVFILMVGGAAGSFEGSAWALSDPEIQEAISEVLGQRHPTDTPQWWKGLGPQAPRIMMGMIETTPHIYKRMRLIGALSNFDDPAVVEFLKQQAQGTPDGVIRNAAIKSIGASQGTREVEFLSKFLTHTDPQTRLAAAETLKKIGDSRANSILEKYLAEEKAGWIVNKLSGKGHGPVALKRVASSEDRLAPEFSGSWKGFRILPTPGSSSGMKSEAAIVRLSIERDGTLKGELNLKPDGKTKKYLLSRSSGKGTHVSGAWAEQAMPGAAAQLEEFEFEGELSQQAGNLIFQMRSPKAAAIFVLRRDPTEIPTRSRND